MNRSPISLLAMLLCLPMPAIAQEKPAAPATPAALDTLIPAIDAHFAGYVEKSHVPGLVYGIVRDGRLIHAGAMGVQELEEKRPVSADSLFRIASMSIGLSQLASMYSSTVRTAVEETGSGSRNSRCV